MSTLRSHLNESIKAMLGLKQLPHSPEAVNAIRQSMLRMLGKHGADTAPQLHTRLHQIHDAQGLWHARVELFAHLRQQHGEPYATECIDALLPLFRDRIPKSLLNTRPGTGPRRRGSAES